MPKTSEKRNKREIELRKELWPDVTEDMRWDRRRLDGYTTLPRTLPMLLSIMDDMAGKGDPVSRTYLTLWGRVFDEGIVRIRDEKMAALESGYNGSRRATLWRKRMRILCELGFIRAVPGGSGEFATVLILNPHHIVKQHWEARNKRIIGEKYHALRERAEEVGAEDFLGYVVSQP